MARNITYREAINEALAQADLDAIDTEIGAEIDKAVDDAKAAPLPTEADLLTDVYVRY